MPTTTFSSLTPRTNLTPAVQTWVDARATIAWPSFAAWFGQKLQWFKVVASIFPVSAKTQGKKSAVAALRSTKQSSFPVWWPCTVQALCHSSFSYDYPWAFENNERLEFLGDSVLQLLLSEIFYARYPAATEGDLSRWRSAAVNARVWEMMAYLLKLDVFLLVGKSTQEHISLNMLADAWEAFWGVAYLHLPWPQVQAGFKRALQEFARVYGQDFVAYATHYVDAKSRLQEILMQKKLPLPRYTCQVLPNQRVQVELAWGPEQLTMEATSRKEGEAFLAAQLLAKHFSVMKAANRGMVEPAGRACGIPGKAKRKRRKIKK